MKVWKKQTIRYQKSGMIVSKGTKGSRKITILSKRFYGTLKTAQGKTKQAPLTEDEKSSEKLLHKLQSDEDRKLILGLSDEDQYRRRLVDQELTQYFAYLNLKGNTPEYVKTTKQRLTKLLNETKAKTLADLDAGKVLKTLDKWKSSVSLETCNHYIRAIKGFAKWLIRERKIRDDPFVGLKTFNSKTDRRRNRRAFTDDELSMLLRETQQCSKRYLGKDWQFLPLERVMLYRIA